MKEGKKGVWRSGPHSLGWTPVLCYTADLAIVRVLEDIPKLFVLEAHLRSSDENLMFEVTNVLYDGQARLIGMKTHILTSRISSECQVSLFTTTALKSIALKRSACIERCYYTSTI
jgi:hypothetical protein